MNCGNERVQSKEEGLKRVKRQCQVRCQKAMTCYVVEVLEGGAKWTFQNPSHFCEWLGGQEGNPADVYIRGEPARGGQGSTEVVRFLLRQLWLSNDLHRWQKRKVSYLLK